MVPHGVGSLPCLERCQRSKHRRIHVCASSTQIEPDSRGLDPGHPSIFVGSAFEERWITGSSV